MSRLVRLVKDLVDLSKQCRRVGYNERLLRQMDDILREMEKR